MSTRTNGEWRAVVGLMMFAQVACASDSMRLEGLDRLYFERVAGRGAPLRAPEHIAALLPDSLQEPALEARRVDGPASAQELTLRDFEVPRPGTRTWIREVLDHSHPRITDSWWALYDGGRRGDVWKFAAFPERNDGKLLSNYRLHGVAAAAGDLLVLRVQGEMSRPGGAWTVAGKEWSFAVSEAAITLTRVRNNFGFFQSETLGMITERDVEGGVEVRQLDDVPSELAARCQFQDPTTEEWRFSWENLASAASCITSAPAATLTRRDPQAPSFIERPRRD